MGENSNIEWTDHTWNPWYGCQKVSTGCKNCYMYREMRQYGKEPTMLTRSKSTFEQPLRWSVKRPGSRVFTCSWSDFFIPGADNWRAAAWDIIRKTPQLHYLILTKRPELILPRLPSDWGDGWPHVWLGVSIESQAVAKMRLRELLKVPARRRFLSLEPLLDFVDLTSAAPAPDDEWIWDEVNLLDDSERPAEYVDAADYAVDWDDAETGLMVNPEYRDWHTWRELQAKHILLRNKLYWVIAGGETGPGARPCHPDWVRAVRDFCADHDVPFFFKGWGDLMPLEADPELASEGQGISVQFQAVGKRQAGRMLDGREWLGIPAEFER